jgi:hypothetical protein
MRWGTNPAPAGGTRNVEDVTDHPSGNVGTGPLKDPERRRAADAAGTIRHSSNARNSRPRRSGDYNLTPVAFEAGYVAANAT